MQALHEYEYQTERERIEPLQEVVQPTGVASAMPLALALPGICY